MYFPNYKDGSIVNLMSSIGGSFRAKLPYTPLPQLLPLELAASTNIVLFVIDGLGYEMLLKYAQGSILFDNIRAKLTSVFPSTTAACMTTFLTGVAPQQHAITGWLMYLRELGDTIVLLRGMTRSGASFEDINIKASDIVTAQPFAEKLNAPSFLIKGDDILGSDYTQTLGKGSKKIGYKKLQV